MPPTATPHPTEADEATLTKTGKTISIKNATSSVVGGELLYLDSAGDIQQLNPSTSGYFLQTQGDGSAPAWAQGQSNVASGIIPTVSGFTVDPTNLGNSTDEDPSTATGEGSFTGATSSSPTWKWDLGQNKIRNNIKIKWSATTSNNADISFAVSQNDSSYTTISTLSTTTTTSHSIDGFYTFTASDCKFRYVKLSSSSINGGGGDTLTAFKVFELVVI